MDGPLRQITSNKFQLENVYSHNYHCSFYGCVNRIIWVDVISSTASTGGHHFSRDSGIRWNFSTNSYLSRSKWLWCDESFCNKCNYRISSFGESDRPNNNLHPNDDAKPSRVHFKFYSNFWEVYPQPKYFNADSMSQLFMSVCCGWT